MGFLTTLAAEIMGYASQEMPVILGCAASSGPSLEDAPCDEDVRRADQGINFTKVYFSKILIQKEANF